MGLKTVRSHFKEFCFYAETSDILIYPEYHKKYFSILNKLYTTTYQVLNKYVAVKELTGVKLDKIYVSLFIEAINSLASDLMYYERNTLMNSSYKYVPVILYELRKKVEEYEEKINDMYIDYQNNVNFTK